MPGSIPDKMYAVAVVDQESSVDLYGPYRERSTAARITTYINERLDAAREDGKTVNVTAVTVPIKPRNSFEVSDYVF